MPIFRIITSEAAELSEPLCFDWRKERLGCFNQGCPRGSGDNNLRLVLHERESVVKRCIQSPVARDFRNNRSLSVWRNMHRRRHIGAYWLVLCYYAA